MIVNTNTPLISVIIPTYNYAHLLPRAIKSVLQQKCLEEAEIVVIDDGSTDNTSNIIESMVYLAATTNASFRYLHQTNSGAAAARNYGLCESKGHFILFLDADDSLMPGALESIIQTLQDKPDSTLILGGHISAHENSRDRIFLPPSHISSKPCRRLADYLLKKQIRISHGAMVACRTLLEKRPYAENLKKREDIPVFAHLITYGKTAVIKKPLVKIFKHNDSLRHTTVPVTTDDMTLVNEVFATLPEECHFLRRKYAAKRFISICRDELQSGDKQLARYYYLQALKTSPGQAFSWKAIRYWAKIFF